MGPAIARGLERRGHEWVLIRAPNPRRQAIDVPLSPCVGGDHGVTALLAPVRKFLFGP